MGTRQSFYRGCLLGMAVGDAMGYTINQKSWDEIQEDYGPNGLMGYDLVNGYAEVTSHTQLSAFTANALLLGLTRGQTTGTMAPLIRYIGLGQREWAKCQRYRSPQLPLFCWLSRTKELCTRRCMDTFMLDTLGRERLGTMEEPVNKFITPGAITTAIPVGLISDGKRMPQPEIDRLAAETVALTHGGALAFLTGGVIAHMISGILRRPDCSLESLALDAVDAVEDQLGRQYSQFSTIRELVQLAVSLAKTETENPVATMEQLVCDNCAQVLAGAIYACIVSREDFDTAMITAVNHSGSSAAVGALTGAFLGAALGEEALPEFYLECLEPVELLREVADDLAQGCPMEWDSGLFDDDWDQKYVHGQPVSKSGWYEV